MQRSNAQKILLLMSIITILLAGIIMLGGVLTASVSLLAGLPLLIYGLLQLLVGIFGIMAAGDNQKVMPVWLLSMISLMIGIGSFIASIIGQSYGDAGNALSRIVGIAFAGFIFWAANTIKQEAGK